MHQLSQARAWHTRRQAREWMYFLYSLYSLAWIYDLLHLLSCLTLYSLACLSESLAFAKAGKRAEAREQRR